MSLARVPRASIYKWAPVSGETGIATSFNWAYSSRYASLLRIRRSRSCCDRPAKAARAGDGALSASANRRSSNKAAILFSLQSEEWLQTSAMLETILQDKAVPPLVRAKCEEAPVRMALADAAPIYRDAPEAIEARAAGTQMFRDFIDEVLPNAPLAARTLAGDLVMATLTEVGREFSETPRTEQEITCDADALADMLRANLTR
ncbi:hypothetical protein GTP41_19620 [Pseudoduganella sp. DS3]|uniref:Tetracyclin repressor-like C-terminal domain-containing protein n=2 Tax=Pseudoduganella guangdongensis TaxID=2692179 RepID=A0A6N9HNN1_9BURK|nr:hypothetical protein [Pseudoduganella guangdongensis]